MNVSFINPFLIATRHVFDTMVHVPFTLGKPYLKQPTERMFKLYKVSAVIGCAGAVRGLLVLNLSEPVVMALVAGMTGVPVHRLDADCIDAIGELASMIAGGAKKDLPGGHVHISTPAVRRTYQVVYPENMPVVCIPVDTGLGRFVIEVAMNDSHEPASAPGATPAGVAAPTTAAATAAPANASSLTPTSIPAAA
jgi:chemotaxis protein CheX